MQKLTFAMVLSMLWASCASASMIAHPLEVSVTPFGNGADGYSLSISWSDASTPSENSSLALAQVTIYRLVPIGDYEVERVAVRQNLLCGDQEKCEPVLLNKNKDQIELRWDGHDDAGKPVLPGKYAVEVWSPYSNNEKKRIVYGVGFFSIKDQK